MNSFLTHNALPYHHHQPTQMHQMMMPEPKYSPPDDYGSLQNYMGSPDFFSSPHHHHHHHPHNNNNHHQHHPHLHAGHHHHHHNGQQQAGLHHQQQASATGGGSASADVLQQHGDGTAGAAVGGGGGGGHYQGHYQQQMHAMYPSPGQTPSYYTSAAPNYGAYQMHHGGLPLEAQQPPAALMHNAAAQQCGGGGGGVVQQSAGCGGVQLQPSSAGAGLQQQQVMVQPHDIKDDSSPSPLPPCSHQQLQQPSPSSSNHMSNNPLDGSCSDDMDDCNTDTDEMMMTTVNGSPIMMDDSESSDRVIYPWMKKNHVAGMRKSVSTF